MYQYSVPLNITPLSVFSSNIIYFSQKQPIKVQICEILECSRQYSSNCSCQFWTDKSILFQFLHQFLYFFIVMTLNSPVNFKFIHFLLWTKRSHQSLNFETFVCSGENLKTSSCHFWKRKSVFLQILYQTSVPSNLTLLYFLSPSLIYCGQKQPIKEQIFEILKSSGQTLSNSSCQLWPD